MERGDKIKVGLSRRSFLREAMVGAAGASLAGSLGFHRKSFAFSRALSRPEGSPLYSISDPSGLNDFNGDNFARAHGILWDKEDYLRNQGGIPAPSEKAGVVILGGGIAGLTTAYSLKDQHPILLEQAPNFGGNARGERWDDLAYSIGAAYISHPDEGSASADLLGQLGLLSHFREEKTEAVIHEGKILEPFWDGATDPARAAEFRAYFAAIEDIRKNRYPDIPRTDSSELTEEELFALDRMSFKDWNAKTFGALHPHIEEYLQDYCWSSFGGTFDEISAAQGINFLAADLAGLIALPGGNSAIAQALFDKLSAEHGASARLRTGCFAVDARINSDGVAVCYEDPQGKLKTIQARACVVCSPKFVAGHVVDGIPQDQQDAISNLEYRAYLVANVLLKKRAPSHSYGLFMLSGKTTGDPVQDSQRRGFTDVVMASWADLDHPSHSALTLYKALPYAGGRQELYQAGSFDKYKTRFETALPEVLSTLQIQPGDVSALRITRWGHALPLARVGLLATRTVETAARPIGKRIYFAQQDNWANPSFETAVSSAMRAARGVRQALTG